MIAVVRRLGLDARGQSLVEFALIFPVMMLLLVALFDVGRLVFAYTDVTNAARTGVRVAIVDQTANKAHDTTIAQATSLGLTSGDVTVTYLKNDLSGTCATPYVIGCLARVNAQFQWQAITPIIGNLIGPMTVRTQTTMPIERIYP